MTVLDRGARLNALGGAPARVAQRRQLSENVIELAFELVDHPVPSWSAGAHIDVCLAGGMVRQYSLCGKPDEDLLRIAVLREDAGSGGSAQVHETLHEGVDVALRGPRNHFHLDDADEYVFVAGGIGITPILAMIRQANESGRSWTLFYGGRSRSTMVYVSELEELACRATGRARATFIPEDKNGRLDIPAIVATAGEFAPVYACGPEPLLHALEAHVGDRLDSAQLRLERFAAGAKQVAAVPDDGALPNFEVVVSSSKTVLPVGPDDRIIDMVRTVAPQVPFSCEDGYCGSCETGVLEGLPCHRDSVLSDDERAANDTMMICVGRALSARIVLDL